MPSSDTFGAQAGSGEKVVQWMNEQIGRKNKEGKMELSGQVIETSRFGKFELLAYDGDLPFARDLIVKASKRFKIKTLEGGYKPKAFFSFSVGSREYAKVHSNGSLVGYVELTKARLLGAKWGVTSEKGS